MTVYKELERIHAVTQKLPNYTCGYCSRAIVGEVIFNNPEYQVIERHDWGKQVLFKCPSCHNVTFYNNDELYPPPVGYDIGNLSEVVKKAYKEAKVAFYSKSYLACVLVCRNIIMYVAVDNDAKQGKKFVDYVDYLVESELITKQMKGFATEIRQNGNTAAHDIDTPSIDVAHCTLDFTTKLLRQVYEDTKAKRTDLADDPKLTTVSTPWPPGSY